jgi:ferredoxin
MTRAHASITDITESPAPAGPIRLVVNLNRCQGYAQCCFLAPSVFKLHGEEALWYDPAPDEAQREHIVRAAAACPVQAITVERPAEVSRQHRKHTEHREESHAAQRA